MDKLGKLVAVVFAGSLALGGGVAEAKTTKAAPRTSKQAKKTTNKKAKQPKQDEMLLPLVGRKSPFGNLAPVQHVAKTDKKTKRTGAGLNALSRRASFNFKMSRTSKSAMPSNQTMLRMTAEKLKSKDINKVIRANVAQVHVCYERALHLNRAPKGMVSVKFVVEPNGTVSSTSVSCGKKNRALKRCMERRIKTWKFPKADAPTTVDYPFVFDVAESKAGKSK